MRARCIFGHLRIRQLNLSSAEMHRSQAMSLRLVIGTAILSLSIATNAPWALGQQVSIAKEGAGGALGPSVVTFGDLPSTPTTKAQSLVPPEPETNLSVPQTIFSAPVQTQSQDAGENAQALVLPHLRVKSAFTTHEEIDVAGATNGTYIFASDGNGTFTVYDLTGNIIKQTLKTDFWCGGNPALPICSFGGFDGDQRIIYDPGARRWIITALWLPGSSTVATDVIAVSQSNDPRFGWNLYQFPACGSSYTLDHGDQPHTGFNKRWIVINSGCASQNGVPSTGLAVFNKDNLYRGGSLTVNTNWFEFVDPFNGEPDNPTLTYTTATNREYLTHADVSPSGFATTTYSYLSGPTDAPVLHSAVETVTTSFKASLDLPPVSAPGCAFCMRYFTNVWIHSSSVWAFRNRVPHILSTVIVGNPAVSNGTQVISMATSISTGRAVALRTAALTQNGSGAMASEIAMPIVSPSSVDEALIVYDYSSSSYFPGVKAVLWNMDKNSVIRSKSLMQGILTPSPGFDRSRWVDFIDAIAPIPGTSKLVLAGSVAAASSTDSEHATYWAQIQP
jgi:hypothetical protein